MFFSASKLADRLKKSSEKFAAVFSKFNPKNPSPELLVELEESLISADVSVAVAQQIIKSVSHQKFESTLELKNFMASEIAKMLSECEKSLILDYRNPPQVVMFCGVNGVGKTTTLGKVASSLIAQNKKVLISACDTFRAAASDQLAVWAAQVGAEIIRAKRDGEDPAAIAYQSLIHAQKHSVDVVLIDTAGRLQNKIGLMDELKKINSVLKKLDLKAPHQNILVVDATTGRNAEDQLEIFDQAVKVTGLVITKLDGSAKGGVVISLAQKAAKIKKSWPIYAIGVGEKVADLQEFNAREFARNLIGL